MEETAALINSIATILWPVIAIIILFAFRKSVTTLIESARGRKFKVKIGDMEVAMDELSQQQTVMIKDLQQRVNELQRRLDEGKKEAVKAVEEKRTSIRDRVKMEPEEDTEDDFASPYHSLDIDDDISAILWVDDMPTNNALLIDALQNLDITVSTAESTSEAIERFEHGSFDCVISDSCRREGREYDNCQAGIELASYIREMDDAVPIYIYTDRVDEKLKQKAESVGATAVTSSPSELLKLLSD